MPSRRLERVAAQIVREVGDILERRLSDPELGLVTVRTVDVAPNFHRATIFVGVVGDAEQCQRSVAALGRASRLIRAELGRRMRLRVTPALEFQLDPAMLTAEGLRQQLRGEAGNDADGVDRGAHG